MSDTPTTGTAADAEPTTAAASADAPNSGTPADDAQLDADDRPTDVIALSGEPSGGSGLRRTRRALWIAVAVGVVFAGLVVALARTPPAADRVADSPLVGRAVPDLEAPTIDGGHVNIDTQRGRWVLVNFFATWCVPCRQEHPDLIRFHERHQAAGDATVIGVVYADSYQAVRDFRRDHGGTWPMAEDPDGRIALNWGVSGVPESFLVDPTGVIRARIVGGVTDAHLEQLLTQAQEGN